MQMRELINLIEQMQRDSYSDSYLDLKGFSEFIIRQTNNPQLGRDFYWGNNRPEFAHEDELGTSTELYTQADALADDTDMVNDWLKSHNIHQFSVKQITLTPEHEPQFQIQTP